MTPGRAESPNRSRWMRAGRECMAAGDWAGAIRTYAQGLMEQPLLGMHYAANLERARTTYRKERQTINQQGPDHTTVVVAAAELSHNAAGSAAGQPFSPVGAGAMGADPRSGAAARATGAQLRGGARAGLCEPGLGAGVAAVGGTGGTRR